MQEKDIPNFSKDMCGIHYLKLVLFFLSSLLFVYNQIQNKVFSLKISFSL